MIDSIFTTMRRRCCVPAADEISNGGLCTCMSQLTAEIKSEIKLSIELLPCASYVAQHSLLYVIQFQARGTRVLDSVRITLSSRKYKKTAQRPL